MTSSGRWSPLGKMLMVGVLVQRSRRRVAPIATGAAWAEGHARELQGDDVAPESLARKAWETDPHNTFGIEGEDADAYSQRWQKAYFERLREHLAGPPENLRLSGGIWRYHPFGGEFEVVAHGMTNPWGLDWNEDGELFVSGNCNGHLWHIVGGSLYDCGFGAREFPFEYGRTMPIEAASHFCSVRR